MRPSSPMSTSTTTTLAPGASSTARAPRKSTQSCADCAAKRSRAAVSPDCCTKKWSAIGPGAWRNQCSVDAVHPNARVPDGSMRSYSERAAMSGSTWPSDAS